MDESAGSDEVLMQKALGIDPEATDALEVPFSEDLKKRVSNWIRVGLPENELALLLTQYQEPEFLKVPILNDEFSLNKEIPTHVKTRDEYFCEEQQLTATAILSAGAMIAALTEKIETMDKDLAYALIEMQREQIQILAQLFAEQSVARRAYILPNIKDVNRRQLCEKQKTDKFLFGSDLSEKLKSIKNVEKSADQLAGTASKTKTSGKSFLDVRAAHPGRGKGQWSSQNSQNNRRFYSRGRGAKNFGNQNFNNNNSNNRNSRKPYPSK